MIMPPVVRMGDICTGHPPYPPRPNVQGSPNVMVNGIPAHRVGDFWPPHCGPFTCHPGTAATGSSSVMVNGMPVCRMGDMVSCGSAMAIGSPNVMAGG